MNKNNFNILKYIVYGIIIYLLFNYIPKTPIPNNDIVVIISIILMTHMLLDYITLNKN